MEDAKTPVIALIFARRRNQTLSAGAELGVFEVVGESPTYAVEIADQLDIDRDNGYRLLRALSSLGLLDETSDRRFLITPAGELLKEAHPASLRGVALLAVSPTRNAVWTHLPDRVREGNQNAVEREFDLAGSVEYWENQSRVRTDLQRRDGQLLRDAFTTGHADPFLDRIRSHQTRGTSPSRETRQE